jgi:hypothetical protein
MLEKKKDALPSEIDDGLVIWSEWRDGLVVVHVELTLDVSLLGYRE